ncbi:hypothetical protein ACFRMQ_15865 [Kitasatospora sp. NPDC056783]|uniref:hypothetical protein n=1 Tax=Kitasatospora sp. NPDC056783 TaxID=3345943 RepID=UPI0036BBF2D4
MHGLTHIFSGPHRSRSGPIDRTAPATTTAAVSSTTTSSPPEPPVGEGAVPAGGTPDDAAYVAVAEVYGVPLVTADLRLMRAGGPRCEIRGIRRDTD